MISLTPEQKQRLKDASSNLSMEERSKLTLAESQVVSDRIDKVLYELHMENPLAFITNASLTLDGVEFLPLQSMAKRRKFYHEPVKVNTREYHSHVVPLPKNKLI